MSTVSCQQIEVRLTGYVDRELTQQDLQKVELHLESCPACRGVVEELRTARSLAESLKVPSPSNEEWDSMQSRILEKGTRRLGWVLLVVWVLVTSVYALVTFAVSSGEPLIVKIIVFGLLLALAMLFCSVLSERLRERRTDRYTGVQQ